MKKTMIPAALAAVLFLTVASPAAAIGLAEAQDAARGLLSGIVKLSGRAQIAAAAPGAPARTCWERAAQKTADALELPKRVCLDGVKMEKGELIVTGEPVSGRFKPAADGRAVVSRAERSEGACEEGLSASLFIAVDGAVTATVGTVHDVCHSSWEYEAVVYRRLP